MSGFDWKVFVNTKLNLNDFNFDKIENLELYNDEYKRISFLSHNFVNYDRSCNNNNNKNNNKKTKCSNFSNILQKCETEYLGPEVKTYNCEKFLLLLRSPLIEPLFLSKTPELLFNKKNYNKNKDFNFDFKKEFKKLGFYNALIKDNDLEEAYGNMDVNNIEDLVKLFSILINKINPQTEEELYNEVEDVENKNNMLEEAFDDYINIFMKNELQGGGIGSFVKKTINRIAIVGLGCLYYLIKFSILSSNIGAIIIQLIAEGTMAPTPLINEIFEDNMEFDDFKNAFYLGDLYLIDKFTKLRILSSIIVKLFEDSQVMIEFLYKDNKTKIKYEYFIKNMSNLDTERLKKQKDYVQKILNDIKNYTSKYLKTGKDYKILNNFLEKKKKNIKRIFDVKIRLPEKIDIFDVEPTKTIKYNEIYGLNYNSPDFIKEKVNPDIVILSIDGKKINPDNWFNHISKKKGKEVKFRFLYLRKKKDVYVEDIDFIDNTLLNFDDKAEIKF